MSCRKTFWTLTVFSFSVWSPPLNSPVVYTLNGCLPLMYQNCDYVTASQSRTQPPPPILSLHLLFTFLNKREAKRKKGLCVWWRVMVTESAAWEPLHGPVHNITAHIEPEHYIACNTSLFLLTHKHTLTHTAIATLFCVHWLFIIRMLALAKGIARKNVSLLRRSYSVM